MNQILEFINKLNKSQKIVIIVAVTVLFLFLIGLSIYSASKANDAKLNYIIASKLTKNQVMLASNELDIAGIPFSITGRGNSLTLKTSKKNVNIAKIKLVTSEAIVSKHTGWEIFDKSSLGSTNFENNIKFLRATEGELARSLEALNGIVNATIKIAIPKQTVFVQKVEYPTASAILVMQDGSSLTQKQINGIKNFIASSVPKLKPQNIKLINQYGALLEHTREDVQKNKYVTHEKYRIKIEENFEHKIQTLLEPFLGKKKIIAKVTVELDYTNQLIEQEIYEPEGTIRSKQVTEDTSNKEELVSAPTNGVPGVQSNIKEVNKKKSIKSKSQNEKTKNIVNYEISKKVIKQKDNGFAKIRKISAAVTFDSMVLDKIDNKEEFMNNIKSIVEEAIGINKNRGDLVSVKSFRFINLDSNVSNSELDRSLYGLSTKSFLSEYSEIIQYIISAILLFVFYKKFVASNDIELTSNDDENINNSVNVGVANEDFDYEEFDVKSNEANIKNKVKAKLLSNIEGLDEETVAKYEVLVEELENQINNEPESIAKMIEMLLNENDTNLKTAKG